jgi:hypothetical protein
MEEEYYNRERSNYRRDPRVRAEDEPPWYLHFAESGMTAYVLRRDEDGEEYEHPVKVKYAICDLCDGKGMHVNPSIDCDGMTREELWDDPDFAEDYFDGAYDVPCKRCLGKRVVIEPINPEEIVNE